MARNAFMVFKWKSIDHMLKTMNNDRQTIALRSFAFPTLIKLEECEAQMDRRVCLH